MKTLFLLIASLLVSASMFAQGKGQGAMNTLTVDMTQAGINYATITVTDLKTGIEYSASTSNGMMQELKVPKKGSFIVKLEMRNDEDGEVSFWLDWQNINEGVGITLQTTEQRSVANGPTAPVTFEKNAVLQLWRL